MPRSKEPLRFPMARGHSPATPSCPIAPGAAGCPHPPAPAPHPPVPGTPQSQLRQATSSKLALFQPGQLHQETIWKGGSSKLFSTLTTRQNTGWVQLRMLLLLCDHSRTKSSQHTFPHKHGNEGPVPPQTGAHGEGEGSLRKHPEEKRPPRCRRRLPARERSPAGSQCTGGLRGSRSQPARVRLQPHRAGQDLPSSSGHVLVY